MIKLPFYKYNIGKLASLGFEDQLCEPVLVGCELREELALQVGRSVVALERLEIPGHEVVISAEMLEGL